METLEGPLEALCCFFLFYYLCFRKKETSILLNSDRNKAMIINKSVIRSLIVFNAAQGQCRNRNKTLIAKVSDMLTLYC